MRASALLALVAAALLSSCGTRGDEGGGVTVAPTVVVEPGDGPSSETEPSPDPSGVDGGGVGTQPGRLSELPSEAPVAPTRLVIDTLGIDAPVVAVGVEPDGSMEVPAATDVGWYRFGPVPGSAEGSAVLAAHVDYDGVEGVFFDLGGVEPGAVVLVSAGDGSTARYVIESVTRVPKIDLSSTEVFDRTGPPRLTLITCGGEFDRDARSYEDNVVATAVPDG